MNYVNKLTTCSLLILSLFGPSCSKNSNTQKYVLVESASTASWEGCPKSGACMKGSVHVKSLNLEVSKGKVKSGSFIMPLSGLENFNLPSDSLKDLLIHHLQSADFFNMSLHPDLTFNIKLAEDFKDSAGAKNYMVHGIFTMLGKPLEISFPAKIDIGNKKLSINADLTIDRRKWGMLYATSDTLPDNKYIMPDVKIHLQLSGVAM